MLPNLRRHQRLHDLRAKLSAVDAKCQLCGLAEQAANATAEAPTVVVPMFATGHVTFDRDVPNGTMYGMGQCMRDLTREECGRCLQDSVPHLPECCYGRQGGLVLGYNCYLRMEVYAYYDLALDAQRRPSGFVPPTEEAQGELSHILSQFPFFFDPIKFYCYI